MKTKNLTPFDLGAKVTSRQPRHLEMALVARGTFRLSPGEPLTAVTDRLERGFLTADTFAEDDDERAGECLYPGDFADFKLKTDVMVRGTCHPPGGRVARECSVRVRVGAWSKALVVLGRRVWTESLVGKAISDPQTFTSMPLTWAHAFGGPDLAQNPVGMGAGTPELPNVEYPGARLQSKRDRPQPAGFGPINPAWTPRKEKVGKEYGETWRKKRAPFYAEDFDWSYFNAAPADQQLPYLRGDEDLSFENLHPDASLFTVRLPGLRARAAVRGADGAIADVVLVLDTLLADLDAGRLYLTWRGLTPVREDNLADVKTVLLASEPLGEPLPAEHYHAMLAAFEADPLQVEESMPKGATEKLAALEAIAAEDEAHPDLDPLERSAAILETKPELFPQDVQPRLAEMAGRVREAAAKAKGAPPKTPDPAVASGKLQDLLARARELGKLAQASGMSLPNLDALEKVLASPRVAAAVPAVASKPRPEPGPGADFTEQDLSGHDLSGRDLSGATFDRTILKRTKLAGANLRGATLTATILGQADLTGADLSGATITRSLFAGARLCGTHLAGAKLSQLILDKADLTGASFERAEGDMVAFGSAILSGVNFRGAVFQKAMARGGPLDGADFTGADLTLCLFLEMQAQRLILHEARLERTSFARSDLRGAKVTDAHGRGSIWTGATLDGADFSFARLPDAQLTEASAKGTIFFGADLRGARFYRAALDGAQLFHANLAGADLNKASLNGAVFREANLYDAKLLGAKGKDCDFSGAYTARARFEEA